ncbi:MAG TPA: RagB/SusD family nutrient uptake outer membrane protein [Bacteroidales bacterium]|nr:RagB/SusD family nutrient uptake outer membrane protein [Bacteroidales bacterium]HOX75957.1 RagB/SusD family nutrient uptake outer membrane protein [Bacteroidales bacterium]HPM86931.1 RagB/SusD family nutrient uptake outer membrane protein [Bacteroidales bacterium]HQM70308.1 RagB/SusD family nutrient uptake outer membrane protein [Bacteroidales bacterium]
MKNIFKGSIILALVLLITGCSKDEWMNPAPITSLSDLTVFDTKERIELQVNAMYSSLKSGQHLGGRFQVYNDVRCDNFIPNSSNLVTCFATWNHTVISSTNEVQNLWGAVYQTINVINVFLDGLTAAWDAGKVSGFLTQAEYDQYRGEALALRAICYFDLMQMYSKPYHMGNGANRGVPLRLTANKSAEGNDMAPSTVAEVYTQILKDLNDAESIAATNLGDDYLNITRIHKNTIIAFKTRVYMHMQNWGAVVTESAKIVPNAAPYTASSGVANALNANYAGIFASPNTTKESIFSLPNTASNNAGTQNHLAHYFESGSDESYHVVQTAGSAFAAMDATDARKVMMKTVGEKVYLTKYIDRATRTDWSPVIRWAEVLLNRAEALVRSGGTVDAQAVNLLNAVRTRSFATGAYNVSDFVNAQAFYDAVLLERNMEFLGEGIRNMDIMRLGLTIPGKDGGGFGSVAAIPSNAQAYFWPVPDSELSYNKQMTP